jgi:hypothetical protein
MTSTPLTLILAIASCSLCADEVPARFLLAPEDARHWIEDFNRTDDEPHALYVPNDQAWGFLSASMPLFSCPDRELEKTYYFRWWTFRKHIVTTPTGFVFSEFLPTVPWAGAFNTIDCAAGHHLREARWLSDQRYAADYERFWLHPGAEPRRYSFWCADSVWQRLCVTGDRDAAIQALPLLIANYVAWKDHRDPNGLYWQSDDRDGMEESIGGSGYRATINCYQFADAQAIANIADLAGKTDIAEDFRARAQAIKTLVIASLWDAQAGFFKVRPRDVHGAAQPLAVVRELHGYTPWYVGLAGMDQVGAWKQLMDPEGFFAPFGPTTAERRSAHFALSYHGHECQWNGPSWPFATSIALTALANLLNGPPQTVVTRGDYLTTLLLYSASQRLKRDDGTIVPWIDEDLNPLTGDWISRTRLKTWSTSGWDAGKGGRERGKDYNHSTFADLIITGLVGLRPRPDRTIEVNPLLPPGAWGWFCLDHVRYHGHWLTIAYDQSGDHFHAGAGLRILVDGVGVAASPTLERLTASLP